MPRHRTLEQILRLDPERDHQQIVLLHARHEFPFDTVRSLEFALFRTFASPRIAAVLHHGGKFERHAQLRYDDTDLLLSELVDSGYDSPRGRAALRQINRQHGRFAIANEDFLYVLSTFVFEPIRWNARFGWRRMVEQERLAMFYFWREVGRRMNIRDLPGSIDELEQYNLEYERTQFRPAAANRWVADATRDMFLSWFLPPRLRRFGEPVIYALLDDALLDAFGYPRPAPQLRQAVEGALRLRARAIRWLPERRRPQLRTALRHRSYPHGYQIEELGRPTETAAG
jgi:hypothetical protein